MNKLKPILKKVGMQKQTQIKSNIFIILFGLYLSENSTKTAYLMFYQLHWFWEIDIPLVSHFFIFCCSSLPQPVWNALLTLIRTSDGKNLIKENHCILFLFIFMGSVKITRNYFTSISFYIFFVRFCLRIQKFWHQMAQRSVLSKTRKERL